ncbi:hypothetical protein HDV01_002572 [Terramyces sp. JEL0728]|nr:hypothetical protein HDV01_002572 [Terramyces sp. JEL0728]
MENYPKNDFVEARHKGIHFADEFSKPLKTDIGSESEGNLPMILERMDEKSLHSLQKKEPDKSNNSLRISTLQAYPNISKEKASSQEDIPVSSNTLPKLQPLNDSHDCNKSSIGDSLKSPLKLEKKIIHFSDDVLVVDGEMKKSHHNLKDIGQGYKAPTPPPLRIAKSPSFNKDKHLSEEDNLSPPTDRELEDVFVQNRSLSQADIDPISKASNAGLRRRGSVNSRASSENSDDEPLDEEDKTFITKTREKIGRCWERPVVRQVRFYFESYRFKLIVTYLIFLTITGFIFTSTMLIPGILLNSIDVYDGIHIGTILSGHLLFMCGNQLLKCIHKGIICSMVAHKGAQVNDIQSGYLASNAPGGRLRQFIFFISIVLAVLLSFLSLDYQWVPAETLFMTGHCIPATYPYESPIYTNLGDFMQGDVDFALVYTFGIPLEDGIIGGWSSWPMANPSSSFSMNGEGFAYAIFTSCAYPSPALNSTSNFTRVWLTKSTKTSNILEGELTLFLPNASIQTDVDIGFGVYQTCTFITKIGKGNVRTSFIYDEWEMVSTDGVKEISVGKSTIQARNSKGRTFIEFYDQLIDDTYDLTSRYQKVLQYAYNGQDYQPSQGASFSNVLAEGTLPDGYYHDDQMWKGVAVALAVPAHYVMMQFDPSLKAQCEYYGEVGAGIFNVPSIWMTVVQVLLITLIAVCSMNVWWMYLMFEINMATDVAYISMSTKMGMAAALAKESAVLFADYAPHIDSLDADISKSMGRVKIFFGVDIDTLENEVKEVKYGQKHKIIYLKKHFKREEKRMRLENRMKRKSPKENETEPTQKDSYQPPSSFNRSHRASAAFEKKTSVRDSTIPSDIIKSTPLSPAVSTPTPNSKLWPVSENEN